MMGCYESYSDYHRMLDLTERMYESARTKTHGTLQIDYGTDQSPHGRVQLDFTRPWKRASFLDLVADCSGIPVSTMPEQELRHAFDSKQVTDERFFELTPEARNLATLS